MLSKNIQQFCFLFTYGDVHICRQGLGRREVKGNVNTMRSQAYVLDFLKCEKEEMVKNILICVTSFMDYAPNVKSVPKNDERKTLV